MQNRFSSLCEYRGGHVWSAPLLTEDALGNRVMVVACVYCPSVRLEAQRHQQQRTEREAV